MEVVIAVVILLVALGLVAGFLVSRLEHVAPDRVGLLIGGSNNGEENERLHRASVQIYQDELASHETRVARIKEAEEEYNGLVAKAAKDGTEAPERQAFIYPPPPVPPARALNSSTKIVRGRVFVLPGLQKLYRLSLQQSSAKFSVESVDKNFIAVSAVVNCTYKVGDDERSIAAAGQRFMSSQDELKGIIESSLGGELRASLATMKVSEILQDQTKLSASLLAAVSGRLAVQGLTVDSINLSNFDTPGSDYLKDLGRVESARARREAEIREIEAEQAIAERRKDLDVAKAEYDTTTSTKQAVAESAERLEKARQDKEFAVIERETLEEQAAAEEKRLELTVKKPAEASAEAVKIEAQAKAEAVTIGATAAADAERQRGSAEADVTLSVGLAQARALEAELLAANNVGEAALMREVVQALPAVVRAASDPLSSVKDMTIVSTDGAGSLSKAVSGMVSEGSAIASSLLGIDLSSLLGGKKFGSADEARRSVKDFVDSLPDSVVNSVLPSEVPTEESDQDASKESGAETA